MGYNYAESSAVENAGNIKGVLAGGTDDGCNASVQGRDADLAGGVTVFVLIKLVSCWVPLAGHKKTPATPKKQVTDDVQVER